MIKLVDLIRRYLKRLDTCLVLVKVMNLPSFTKMRTYFDKERPNFENFFVFVLPLTLSLMTRTFKMLSCKNEYHSLDMTKIGLYTRID